MNTLADKTPEEKSKSAAKTVTQQNGRGTSGLQFVDNRPEAIAQRKLQELANNSPQTQQSAQLQALVNKNGLAQQPFSMQLKSGMENLSGMSLDAVKELHDSDKSAQLQSLAFAHKTPRLSAVTPNAVAQLVRMVLIESYSGQKIDIDDAEDLANLIEMIEDEYEGPNIKKEIASMPAVLAAIKVARPDLLLGADVKEDEASLRAREKADSDVEGWFVPEAKSTGEKLLFLTSVLGKARSIIPKAFNREVEVGKGNVDYINTAHACKDALVRAYAADAQKQGIAVTNNYIHPAALERMYEIIHQTAPNMEAASAPMTGVCKDFASICYGLIVQNDRSNSYNPKLAFMHGHVYVTVEIGGEPYAVDAWLGGKVIPKGAHETQVSATHGGIGPASHQDKFIGADHQTSLDQSYEKAEVARLTWYQNEARYQAIAVDVWAKGKIEHVNRGSS
jgi:hypothetical protein